MVLSILIIRMLTSHPHESSPTGVEWSFGYLMVHVRARTPRGNVISEHSNITLSRKDLFYPSHIQRKEHWAEDETLRDTLLSSVPPR
ncbi:hypothetical protein TNCV_5021141 [Trichonephila clavipes]|nr:hypothetical protein TNCV_5021141 [Trichonephila clavipes]